jgi:hypothetical protein
LFTEAIKEMFKKLGLQGAESDQGFSVQRTERHSLEYREGDHTLVVEIEPGIDTSGQYEIAVYAQTVKSWLPPFQHDRISKEKKRQILQRIDETLTFLEIAHYIDWAS